MHELLRVVGYNHLLNAGSRAVETCSGPRDVLDGIAALDETRRKDILDGICVYLLNAHTAVVGGEKIPRFEGVLPSGDFMVDIVRGITGDVGAISQINPVITTELAAVIASDAAKLKVARSSEAAGNAEPPAKRLSPDIPEASPLLLPPPPPAVKLGFPLPSVPHGTPPQINLAALLPPPPADRAPKLRLVVPPPPPVVVAKAGPPAAGDLFFKNSLNLSEDVIIYNQARNGEKTTIRGAMVADCYLVGGGVLMPWRGVTVTLSGGNLENKLVAITGLSQLPTNVVGCFYLVPYAYVLMCGMVATVKSPIDKYPRLRIGY